MVAGQDAETLEAVASLYERVVQAGVFRAVSVKVAEAAKVMENTQRDILVELKDFGVSAQVWDPVADASEALEHYGIALADWTTLRRIDGVVAVVAHRQVLEMDLAKLNARTGAGAPSVDVKSAFDRGALQAAGFQVWRL